MTKEQQEKISECLDEATITSYIFDLFKNQIIFELKQDDTGEQHKVIFKNVSAFSYVYDTGELDDLQLEEWDPVNGRLELTSISFWNKINSSLSGAEWASEYKQCYNVVIEIWYKTLLINATDIIVDNEVFKIDNK